MTESANVHLLLGLLARMRTLTPLVEEECVFNATQKQTGIRDSIECTWELSEDGNMWAMKVAVLSVYFNISPAGTH
jgi:hypothetical protein